MSPQYIGSLFTPLGYIIVTGNKKAISCISFSNEAPTIENTNPIVTNCIKQLQEYFAGTRTLFSVPIEIQGTTFQQKVWDTCATIAFGKTSTYKNIACHIQNPKSAIAVGQALKNNPIAIIIPCHRILNSQNKNTGYAGGKWRKDWLLQFELHS